MLSSATRSTSSANDLDIAGLTADEVHRSREQYGSNNLVYRNENSFWVAVKSLASEPMVLLLLVASIIYFINGATGDALFMIASIMLISTISLYQDKKSRDALKKIEEFNQPLCQVIRGSATELIKIEELVIGDCFIAEEGIMIPADGEIIRSNDFFVNEAMLTGESMPVYKGQNGTTDQIYRGTVVVSGLAIAKVIAIGNNTRWGQIGKSIEKINDEKTPLELQIENFIKMMVVAGALVFVAVWILNFLRSHQFLDSLLKSLTLAMSILPEEIPVAFTTFMALGAYRLMKIGVVVKQMKTVESLGSATVICIDKTGTITENNMSIARLWTWPPAGATKENELIETAMWASEPIPFDPMEIALHQAYQSTASRDKRPNYQMAHEYPLGGTPPMMTHVFENKNSARIIAAKGAPEAIIELCNLSNDQKGVIIKAVKAMTIEGYRVLGVAESPFTGYDFPLLQQDLPFRFKGLIAFYDPPKKNIKSVLGAFYNAGIDARIITGDNALTAMAIAKEIEFIGYQKVITGEALMALPEKERELETMSDKLFARMFPEAKLAVINTLKSNNHIVAMTGDGINDAPALKAAHIGIAMGKKGTEIARAAASLILLEDDLSRMVDAIAIGRKIYANLKKAIQYIISIHIPIILTVFIPLALGWVYPNILSPVHVIFLELIMGPTCSIVYENEPMEKNTMHRPPRPYTSTFFNWKELATSVIQGFFITVGTLTVYQFSALKGYNETTTRSMVFLTLITANIFLTLVNRSFHYSMITMLKSRNRMIPLIIFVTIIITAALFLVKNLATFFGLNTLNTLQILITVGVAFVSVIWYEAIKWVKRH